MSNETHIQGHQNVVIQNVTGSKITVSVNGDLREIQNEFAELKALLATLQVQKVQYADKIYNIAHIDEANFGAVTRRIVFNGILVKRLIGVLAHKDEVRDFLMDLPPEAKENWEETPEFLKKAQSLVGQNFVWVLAWELRRLFAIGGEKRKRQEDKVDEYIQHCLSTAKMALQLATFILIAELWDRKKKGEPLRLHTAHIEPFFGTRALTLGEYYQLLSHLVQMFADNDLPLPVDLSAVATTDNPIRHAVGKLSDLRTPGSQYGLGHCHTAESCLADLLMAMPFFNQHHLVTIRRVEYEAARGISPRYVKDFTILEKKDAREWQRILKFDATPTPSYALLMRSPGSAFNLFPFLLDYHALVNHDVFNIQLYEYREGQRGLCFYNIEQEKPQTIYFCEANTEIWEVQSEDQKRDLESKVRCDLAIRQFEDAMNTLLGAKHHFVKESATPQDSLGNI